MTSDNDDDEIVDNEWLVVELLDTDDDDDELDRLLLVLELDRFRFDPLSIDDELKRMSRGCQAQFIICHFAHPFLDDFRRFGDRDDRWSFDDLFQTKQFKKPSKISKHTIVNSMVNLVHIPFF